MIITVIVATLVVTIVSLEIISELAFKKTFLKKKKNKKEAMGSLLKKELLDKKIYNEVEIEDIHIKSKDNLKLKGYLIEKFKDSDRYVILVHGYSDNYHSQMPFVRMFLKEGFNILLVDERNHGESEGDYISYGYHEKERI